MGFTYLADRCRKDNSIVESALDHIYYSQVIKHKMISFKQKKVQQTRFQKSAYNLKTANMGIDCNLEKSAKNSAGIFWLFYVALFVLQLFCVFLFNAYKHLPYLYFIKL